jgi:hypothetical protein
MVLLLVLTQRILRGILRGLTTTKQQPISFTGEIVHRKGLQAYRKDKFQDHKDDCRNEESTAGDDKPATEDEFKDNNNDCRDEESTARD